MLMQITHYLHTALRVSNLEQAEYFYGTVLGLHKVDRQLKFPGAWYQLGDVQIHLILDINLERQTPSSEQWGRDRHLAFAVVDLAATQEHLLQQGCKIQVSASGRAALFTQDPDGHIIELSQT
jgi:glyoxylase I family protein